jgi:cation diffusion facilitator family transporter
VIILRTLRKKKVNREMSAGNGTDRSMEPGQKGLYFSIFAYIFLSALKIGFGLYAGSKALVADGWNNVSDVMASLVILFGLMIARKPADQDHRYGHFRAETAAALIASILMVIVGLDVLKQTIAALLTSEAVVSPDPLSLYIALFAAIVMYFVSRYNQRTAEKTNNLALMAAAYDNRSDALVSVGAAVSIGVAELGWTWADPIVAVLIGLIILKTAWKVGYEAVHALMDGFDAEKLSEIEQQVEQVEGIRQVLEVRARFHGSAVHVDVTVGVDHHLTVVESHALTEKIEEKLVGYEGIERVYVHVEPATR